MKEEEEDDDDVTLIESISDFGKGDETVSFGGDYSDILRDDGAGSSQNMYMQLSTSGEKVELFKVFIFGFLFVFFSARLFCRIQSSKFMMKVNFLCKKKR